jgi:hypothetical protein
MFSNTWFFHLMPVTRWCKARLDPAKSTPLEEGVRSLVVVAGHAFYRIWKFFM